MTSNRCAAGRLSATGKFVLATVTALSLVTLLASGAAQRVHTSDDLRGDAARPIAKPTIAAPTVPWFGAMARPDAALALRDRYESVAQSDSRKWWDSYGKTTTRNRAAVLDELRHQLTQSERAVASR